MNIIRVPSLVLVGIKISSGEFDKAAQNFLDIDILMRITSLILMSSNTLQIYKETLTQPDLEADCQQELEIMVKFPLFYNELKVIISTLRS
jgi:hypothetical protein